MGRARVFNRNLLFTNAPLKINNSVYIAKCKLQYVLSRIVICCKAYFFTCVLML